MRNTGLEEAQAGIKIAGRNIDHLRYADDTTLMAESEEELKSLLMEVKEEREKVGLKLNIQKTTMRYHLTMFRMIIIKKSTNNKYWKGCGEKGIILHCLWECKQSLWRTEWGSLKTSNKNTI